MSIELCYTREDLIIERMTWKVARQHIFWEIGQTSIQRIVPIFLSIKEDDGTKVAFLVHRDTGQFECTVIDSFCLPLFAQVSSSSAGRLTSEPSVYNLLHVFNAFVQAVKKHGD
ncbi:hypothetical protein MAR_006821 [Mya arenaria]|uniref:Uncharacterized protein n=1 Tax=Mya arenaria TaxID=6604 RepID=A0ABY7DCB5_MYAAR|nr:hypothetical protein MAR_006821 [Mya arenaria]